MGFNDKDIVVLSGAHTLGRCHTYRSGFEGPWTTNQFKFDNEYFKNLLELTWTPREWDGPLQYTDESKKLMMLPTDICLTTDPEFRKYVELYASHQDLFLKNFSTVYLRLLANGCGEM